VHDARLNRDIAIKASTEQFSSFEREAKAIAALNHSITTLLKSADPKRNR
jgi:hypothetical protein